MKTENKNVLIMVGSICLLAGSYIGFHKLYGTAISPLMGIIGLFACGVFYKTIDYQVSLNAIPEVEDGK